MEQIKTKQEFDQLTNENKNVVIDFYASWCGPCKMLAPIFENVAATTQNVKFVKVNVDEATELASLFGIQSIPTMIYIKEKKLEKRELGFKTKEQILENIERIF
ncbi:MAG TPA: thioredoxin [Candidatus Caccosoma faecigallinarum]|jgi:thioredoxin|uniref:Thioredoxin n=1 Tax=Candidatus Caccosoma faecigallinarum TaxID=2840720 RepID=A0A9D1G8L4_9FIRM|nr:thioredoxin [Firmicutes bacterium CAG:631]HIT16843.1 thioredoxin [Candidatus Caccosoma faecigallinarum]